MIRPPRQGSEVEFDPRETCGEFTGWFLDAMRDRPPEIVAVAMWRLRHEAFAAGRLAADREREE